jgi:hypothetical protein
MKQLRDELIDYFKEKDISVISYNLYEEYQEIHLELELFKPIVATRITLDFNTTNFKSIDDIKELVENILK